MEVIEKISSRRWRQYLVLLPTNELRLLKSVLTKAIDEDGVDLVREGTMLSRDDVFGLEEALHDAVREKVPRWSSRKTRQS